MGIYLNKLSKEYLEGRSVLIAHTCREYARLAVYYTRCSLNTDSDTSTSLRDTQSGSNTSTATYWTAQTLRQYLIRKETLLMAQPPPQQHGLRNSSIPQ